MEPSNRRNFFKSAGAAALTTNIFTRNIKGANDKINAAFIGMGKMGRSNLHFAMRQENLMPVAVCDVFQRNLDWAVRDSDLGDITFVRTWNYANGDREGYGNPPDGDPPEGLDWDMWLGPAPKRAFNDNRFGVDPKDRYFSLFRYFWDYAGGWMTDWAVHWLDIVQMAFKEEVPTEIAAIAGKLYVKDNTETPDTMEVSYMYPSGFVATYERRSGNSQSMFDKSGGILFCGSKGTMFLDRSGYKIVPETTTRPPETAGGRPVREPLMAAAEAQSTDSGNAS